MSDEEDLSSVLQQLEIWKDKCNRLFEQHSSLLNRNQELEDRLINVVEKIERDKSLLSDEIDHLAEKLACATNTIDHMKNECARYKSDCMLAVHLLQCQPSFYSSQHLNSLPEELKQKLCTDSTVTGSHSGSPMLGNRTLGSEKKVISFSASAMTFPPTAVFLQSPEPVVDEIPPEEPESRNDVRDVFLKKIRMAPEYQTEKLIQCPKCGHAVVKYDRCTQTTLGYDSYLSNSQSAPHLFGLDGERKIRRGVGGDLLIDLSDEDPNSTPASPTFTTSISASATMGALESGPKGTVQQQQRVRFNVSPNVQHKNQNYSNFGPTTTTNISISD